MKQVDEFEKALEILATPPLFTTLRVNTLLTSVPNAIAELKIALKQVGIHYKTKYRQPF